MFIYFLAVNWFRNVDEQKIRCHQRPEPKIKMQLWYFHEDVSKKMKKKKTRNAIMGQL